MCSKSIFLRFLANATFHFELVSLRRVIESFSYRAKYADPLEKSCINQLLLPSMFFFPGELQVPFKTVSIYTRIHFPFPYCREVFNFSGKHLRTLGNALAYLPFRGEHPQKPLPRKGKGRKKKELHPLIGINIPDFPIFIFISFGNQFASHLLVYRFHFRIFIFNIYTLHPHILCPSSSHFLSVCMFVCFSV